MRLLKILIRIYFGNNDHVIFDTKLIVSWFGGLFSDCLKEENILKGRVLRE